MPHKYFQDQQEYDIKYRQEHRNQLLEYKKEYGRRRVLCDCGSEVGKSNLSTHLNSMKHYMWKRQAHSNVEEPSS